MYIANILLHVKLLLLSDVHDKDFISYAMPGDIMSSNPADSGSCSKAANSSFPWGASSGAVEVNAREPIRDKLGLTASIRARWKNNHLSKHM